MACLVNPKRCTELRWLRVGEFAGLACALCAFQLSPTTCAVTKGNAARLLAPWKAGTAAEKKKFDKDDDADEDKADDDDMSGKPSFNSKVLYLGYNEESMKKRRKFSRGTTSIRQIEWCHVVSVSSLCLPERPRKHYDGSNCGNALFNIALPELPGEEWYVDFKTKKACYGKKYRIDVGGKTDGEDENKAGDRRTDQTQEPFAYHSCLCCNCFRVACSYQLLRLSGVGNIASAHHRLLKCVA